MANDDAVRNYLTAIKNPAALQDESKLNELEEAIANTDDVLERLKLKAEAKRLSDVKPEDYEDGFVKNAKDWAQSNDVPVSVFVDEGVDAAVLKRAGFDVSASKEKKTTRSRVSSDTVAEHARSLDGEFTYKDVEDATGASAATVRKVLTGLESDGVLTSKDDPDHDGRGRPAKIFSKA